MDIFGFSLRGLIESLRKIIETGGKRVDLHDPARLWSSLSRILWRGPGAAELIDALNQRADGSHNLSCQSPPEPYDKSNCSDPECREFPDQGQQRFKGLRRILLHEDISHAGLGDLRRKDDTGHADDASLTTVGVVIDLKPSGNRRLPSGRQRDG